MDKTDTNIKSKIKTYCMSLICITLGPYTQAPSCLSHTCCHPVVIFVFMVRRSPHRQTLVRAVPATLFRRGKVDFSSVWFTKHRRCSSVRDALSLCPVSLLLPLANPFLHHPGRGDISPSPAYARPRAVWVEAFMLSYELIHGQLFHLFNQLPQCTLQSSQKTGITRPFDAASPQTSEPQQQLTLRYYFASSCTVQQNKIRIII